MPKKCSLAITLVCCLLFGCRRDLPDLPTLDLSGFAPAVRMKIQSAYDKAQTEPGNASSVGQLGMLLDAHGQGETAAAMYERARALDPQSIRWVYYLGVVRAGQGRHEQAAAMMRVAARLDAKDIPVRLRLAESLLESANYPESEKLFREVLRSRTEEARAWYGLGRSLSAQGQEIAAVDCYRKACSLFPAYGSANYALALLLKKGGQGAEAATYFQLYEQAKTTVPPLHDPLISAVRELDVSTGSRIRKAISLQQSGRTEEAAAELETALADDPTSVQAHTNLINLYGRLAQYDQVEKHFRAATALEPNHADAHYNYGVALAAQEKWPQARQAFEQAVDTNPLHAEAQHNLGSLLEREGKLDHALARYEKAVEAKPDYKLAHFRAGRILANQRSFDPAIQHFLRSLTPADENTPAYLYALAATYARSGDHSRAMVYARQARDSAAALGQTGLIASIEKDFRPVRSPRPVP